MVCGALGSGGRYCLATAHSTPVAITNCVGSPSSSGGVAYIDLARLGLGGLLHGIHRMLPNEGVCCKPYSK